MAAVAIAHVTAKSCNLNAELVLMADGVVFVRCSATLVGRNTLALRQRNEQDSELRSHGVSLRENAHDVIGSRVRGDVVVRWLTLQQQVAHTSADEIGLM